MVCRLIAFIAVLPAGAGAADLFTALPSTPSTYAGITPASLAAPDVIPGDIDRVVSRRRTVLPQMDLLRRHGSARNRALSFNLFDDVRLDGVVDSMDARSPIRSIWSGHLPGHPGGVFTLVAQGDVLIGNVRAPGVGSFHIRYLGGGVHEVRQVDESQYPPCATDALDVDAAPPVQAAALQVGGCDDDGSLIDLMVVYTADARAAQGGTAAMEALIALSEAETNQAYANSLINATSVRVVLTYEAVYEESGSSATDRARLSDPTDGFMDEIHDLRDQVSADVVTLLVNDFEVCGRAFFSISAGNDPHPELGFNVVQASCSAGNYSFGHELGHNQGCRHDRLHDGSDGGAFLYSHGYIAPSQAFRTVMGVVTPGVPRIQFFSNPDVLFAGEPTGVPEGSATSADNVKTILNTAFNVANFRPSRDCNRNGICDDTEIADGTATDCNGNGLPDDCEDDCNLNGTADECDIAQGTSEDCTGDGIPDDCEPDCNVNDVADSCDIAGATSTDANGNGRPDECEPPVLYVDARATGADNGTNWTDAFVSPHGAFTLAADASGAVKEIWVATGVYVTAEPNGDRGLSFQLPPGVGVYGGFSGTETQRDQRDPETYVTTLSADQNGDDGPGFANAEENSYHVIEANIPGTDATTILDGFTITGGNGTDGPDWPDFNGGGLRIDGTSPTIRDCVFTLNRAYGGGGLHVNGNAQPVISRCQFIGNIAGNQGGAVGLNNGSAPVLRDCVFLDNEAVALGSAIGATVRSAATLSHCTFVDNPADVPTRGVLGTVVDAQMTVSGCILWSTQPQTDPMLAVHGGDIAVRYSIVQGGSASAEVLPDAALLWGPGNITADPLLDVDRYHVSPGSPAVGAGDPLRDPADLDIDGQPRVQHCRADVGADEADFFNDCNNNGEADTCEITAGTSKDANLNRIPDDCEPHQTIFVAPGNCPGTGTELDPFCLIQDAMDAAGDGFLSVIEVVLKDGTYTGTGNYEIDFAGKILTLRSENGPANCIVDGDNRKAVFLFHSGESSTSVVDGITITHGSLRAFGGGLFIEQSSPTIRNCVITDNQLISGESSGGGIYLKNSSARIEDCIIADNGAEEGGGIFIDSGSQPVIQGCVISGNRTLSAFFGAGGGIHLKDAGGLIADCLIEGNTVGDDNSGNRRGGGVYGFDSNPRIERCTITSNSVGAAGGVNRFGAGLYFDGGSPVIEDCTISANLGATQGGGVNCGTGTVATFIRCILADNEAADGGAAAVFSADATFQDCLFRSNASTSDGGALYLYNADMTAIQSLFTGNRAGGDGGAILHTVTGGNVYAATVLGSTLSGNEAGGGSGGIQLQTNQPANTFLNVSNSILWGNLGTGSDEEQQITALCPGCNVSVSYNCVQGWSGALGGEGNIGEDPMFVDADGPDGLSGTDDDDVRLFGGSPAIDAGNNDAVPAALLTDFAGDPRFVDDVAVPDTGNPGASGMPIVDMGVFEGGVDCNENGIPDPTDIASGASEDCTGNGVPDECEPDCNGNGAADSCDVANGNSLDWNGGGVPDECDIGAGTSTDCNASQVPDECEPDTDQDGTIDDCDGCPTDSAKTEPGVCGCLVPDVDTDQDTVFDCLDVCPGFNDFVDADLDGVPDGCDRCPGFDDAADGDGDTIADGCDQCPGFDDRLDADGDGVPDGCDQCAGFDDTLDCNGNAVADGCDVRDAVSTDANANGIPDECDPPNVTAAGNRYLTWTPAGTVPVALSATSPDVPCLDHFVDVEADPTLAEEGIGRLVADPVFRLPTEWGAVHIRDALILPDRTYLLRADTQLAFGIVTSAAAAVPTWAWGDVDDDEDADFNDILTVVRGFQQAFSGDVTREATDLRPCLTDAQVDFTDIVAAVDAFKGKPDSCGAPCP